MTVNRLVAWGLVLLGLPLLTWLLTSFRGDVSLESVLLLYLLAVVVVAVVGGMLPGLVAAVTADLLANYYFVPPYGTLHIESGDHVVAIVVFVLVAVIVSVLVEVASRQREEVGRRDAEASMMERLAEIPVGEVSVDAVLDDLRKAFDLSATSLQHVGGSSDGAVIASSGVAQPDDVASVIAVGEGLVVTVSGPPRLGVDSSAMRVMALSAARAYEGRTLAKDAENARTLAELDRVRSALLAAVGHDLRTPLAGVKAGVSSLRQTDVTWSPEEEAELLATIEESADRLDVLVANLLDMTRIQAGGVIVDLVDVSVEEVVAAAVAGLPTASIELDLPDGLPMVRTDPGLLERAVANVVENALRYRPEGTGVQVSAVHVGVSIVVSIIDHGPGIPEAVRGEIFEPFQRLDDRTQGGTGLGLAIAKGFVNAVGGTVEPTSTPGGGLTMQITLPVAS